MTTAVDTNVLLDVLIPDSPHREASRKALAVAFHSGSLVICEAVYAELAGFMEDDASLQRFLSETRVQLVPSEGPALFAGGTAWRAYGRRRGEALSCPACGTTRTIACAQCGRSLSPRQHILADFLIGAHALRHADHLLTRDRGYFVTYFPGLSLL